ncbi:Na(+)/H(+) antiporter [Legionella quinlivanii]|uniref:Na(+)/H(+) antiporter n=1 Tax=Legionella quinlivanii TaxID=45073 RepID=A0A0W0Y242_9GAMM|nr:cation:proton antiporter [Legionella quinlivanii]KTD50676.1 Na(+)/H(+) antiporter [Legionella quinlivanii]MCW8450233.1 cation:proton antiporter [Legionella quinlivanii]SEG36058.1 sodium/proton antiporter NhaS3, CPA2 family (TC 2.A.37.2.4) [Legionella quinlivanii DSM 21216]STY11617.1 Na(+)/H(+) antiporter [Legionella quinlivanii]
MSFTKYCEFLIRKASSLFGKKPELSAISKACGCFLVLMIFPLTVLAQTQREAEHDPVASIIFWVTLIFTLSIMGRCIAKALRQPGVLGELLMGVLLGNICYFFGSELIVVLREGSAIFNIMRDILGNATLAEAVQNNIADPVYAQQMVVALSSVKGIDYLKVGYILDIFSRYGVIFLLFMVGLESSFQELKHTGREALSVALIGVVAPIILGFAIAHWLLPNASYQSDLFVAATLSATSIGITARVLSELKKLRTREAHTILGAAMIDDVLGLIILSIVSSIVINNSLDMLVIVRVVVSAFLFFTAVLTIGPWALRKSVKMLNFLELWEAKLFLAFIFLMALAWFATVVGLSSIIGAFAAGLIIHDGYFEPHSDSSSVKPFNIKQLIAPLEFILAPLFFILIGIQVKLESFFDWHVLMTSAGLIVAAIVGKLISGLGGNRKDDRLLIGIGMLPRGEVGLVFASIGRTLGVISDQLFSAIVLMIIITTFLAPPLLKSRYAAYDRRKNEVNS